MDDIRDEFAKALTGGRSVPLLRSPITFELKTDQLPRLQIVQVGNVDFPIVEGIIAKTIRKMGGWIPSKKLNVRNACWETALVNRLREVVSGLMGKGGEWKLRVHNLGLCVTMSADLQLSNCRDWVCSPRPGELRLGTLVVWMPGRCNGKEFVIRSVKGKEPVGSVESNIREDEYACACLRYQDDAVLEKRALAVSKVRGDAQPFFSESMEYYSWLLYDVFLVQKHGFWPDKESLLRVTEKWGRLEQGYKRILYVLRQQPEKPFGFNVDSFSGVDKIVYDSLKSIQQSTSLLDVSVDVLTTRQCEVGKYFGMQNLFCEPTEADQNIPFSGGRGSFYSLTYFMQTPSIAQNQLRFVYTREYICTIPRDCISWFSGSVPGHVRRNGLCVLSICPTVLRFKVPPIPIVTAPRIFEEARSFLTGSLPKASLIEMLSSWFPHAFCNSCTLDEVFGKSFDCFLRALKGHEKRTEILSELFQACFRHSRKGQKLPDREVMEKLHVVFETAEILAGLSLSASSLLEQGTIDSLSQAIVFIFLMLSTHSEGSEAAAKEYVTQVIDRLKQEKEIRRTTKNQLSAFNIPVRVIRVLLNILGRLNLASHVHSVIEMTRAELLEDREYSIELIEKLGLTAFASGEQFVEFARELLKGINYLTCKLARSIHTIVKVVGVSHATPTLVKLTQRAPHEIAGKLIQTLSEEGSIVESSAWYGLRKKLIEHYVADFSHRHNTESVVKTFQVCLNAGATNELYDEAIANLVSSISNANIEVLRSVVEAVEVLKKQARDMFFVEQLAVQIVPVLKILRNKARRRVERVTSRHSVRVSNHDNGVCIYPVLDPEVEVVSSANGQPDRDPRLLEPPVKNSMFLKAKSSYCEVCAKLRDFLEDSSQRRYRVSGLKRAHTERRAVAFARAGDVVTRTDRSGSEIVLIVQKTGARMTQTSSAIKEARNELARVSETIQRLKNISQGAASAFNPSLVPVFDLEGTDIRGTLESQPKRLKMTKRKLIRDCIDLDGASSLGKC